MGVDGPAAPGGMGAARPVDRGAPEPPAANWRHAGTFRGAAATRATSARVRARDGCTACRRLRAERRQSESDGRGPIGLAAGHFDRVPGRADPKHRHRRFPSRGWAGHAPDPRVRRRRPARTRTTSRPRPTAASGTRGSTRARSATSIPATGDIREIPLGAGSAPHGVIVGPDGAAWITDGGLNAIVRVDGATDEVRAFPLPADRPDANLNTAVFDPTGIALVHRPDRHLRPARSGDRRDGRLRRPRGPRSVRHHGDARRRHLVRVARRQPHRPSRPGDRRAATIVEPPTAGQGARRVWSDSRGRIWVSEWDAGQVGGPRPGDRRRGRSGSCPATGRRPTPSTSTSATSSG